MAINPLSVALNAMSKAMTQGISSATKVVNDKKKTTTTPITPVNNTKVTKPSANTSPLGMALGLATSVGGSIAKNTLANSLPSVNNTPTKTTTNNNKPQTNNSNVRTLANSGYGAFYDKEYKDLESRYNYYTEANSPVIAKSYQDAMNKSKGNVDIYNTFKDWDTGDLDTYIHNKMNYETLGYNTKDQPYYDQAAIDRINSGITKTQDQLAKENAAFRAKYGLENDTYTYNDLGLLGADLIWGDFIGRGITKKGDSEKDNKVRQTAEMLARRDNLFGYEPLGKITEKNGQPYKPDYSGETKLLESLINNTPYENKISNANQRLEETKNVNTNVESSNSMGNGNNMILLDENDPDAGGITETPQGYVFIQGDQQIPLSVEEFLELMEMKLGF